MELGDAVQVVQYTPYKQGPGWMPAPLISPNNKNKISDRSRKTTRN